MKLLFQVLLHKYDSSLHRAFLYSFEVIEKQAVIICYMYNLNIIYTYTGLTFTAKLGFWTERFSWKMNLFILGFQIYKFNQYIWIIFA